MSPTKPYEFIGFGARDVTTPYAFIRFGARDATKPYEFIGCGARDVTKPGVQSAGSLVVEHTVPKPTNAKALAWFGRLAVDSGAHR